MVEPPKEDVDIPVQFQELKLDDAPRQAKRYGAFVTKVTQSHVFFVCVHIGYSFKRNAVEFPEGIAPGWWIGLERTDGGGVNDEIKSITNVRRAMPLFAVTFDPKHPKEIYVDAKFVKRDMSAYPYFGQERPKWIPEDYPRRIVLRRDWRTILPILTALRTIAKNLLYDCIIILKMILDEWDPEQTTVSHMTKTLLGVGKKCPGEEQPKVINTEKKIPTVDVRLLFVYNREVGSIQLKLEKQYGILPVSMLGKFIKFKTTTIAADEDKGYRTKEALFCGEVTCEKFPRVQCKIVSGEHLMESYTLTQLYRTLETEIPVYLKLVTDNHWGFHSIDLHKVELAIEQ